MDNSASERARCARLQRYHKLEGCTAYRQVGPTSPAKLTSGATGTGKTFIAAAAHTVGFERIERYGFVEHTIGRDDADSLEDGRPRRALPTSPGTASSCGSEALLVDEGWAAPEPEPVAIGAAVAVEAVEAVAGGNATLIWPHLEPF